MFCTACGAAFLRDLRRCPQDGAPCAELAQDPALGMVLGDHYLLQTLLGQGGMGRVYYATDVETGLARYAIKILYGDLAADPTYYQRFLREAATASDLHHPNLVRVSDRGTTSGGQPYMVMEYLPGRSLARLVAEHGPLEPAQIVPILADIARALEYLHAKAIIHRDVKPSNVMVAEPVYIAKLFDYGVALGRDESARLTQKNATIGTLSYMAPEWASEGGGDHRSDLFSLGVMLYFMLAGVRPFRGTPTLVALAKATQDPPSIAERAGLRVDSDLEALAHWLMAREPDQRPSSAGQVISEIAGRYNEWLSPERKP